MARRIQAPPVADVISYSPPGCERGPTGTSPARGEIVLGVAAPGSDLIFGFQFTLPFGLLTLIS